MSSQSGFLTAPGGFGVATRTPSLARHLAPACRQGLGLSGASRLPAREVACRLGSSIAVLLSPGGLGLGLGVSRQNTRGRRQAAGPPGLDLNSGSLSATTSHSQWSRWLESKGSAHMRPKLHLPLIGQAFESRGSMA